MRLVGIEGEPIGIVSITEAMRLAEEKEIDLVEIAPTAKPPVCRLMDYGKFKYRESKKAHEAKLKQKQIQVKEVKFRPGTDEGDYKIKVRNLTRFLTEGDKTKVTLRFRTVVLNVDGPYQLIARFSAPSAPAVCLMTAHSLRIPKPRAAFTLQQLSCSLPGRI